MVDKRLQIIEAAVKCFAHKGFHATSIQEIADTAGIAKGSLYFYFKSKEDLLLSTFRHYYVSIVSQLTTVAQDHSLSPKERLFKQLHTQFNHLTESRDIILMLLNEHTMQVNDEMREFFFSIRAYSLYWVYKQILDIYGEEARLYAIEGSVYLNAMMNEYLFFLLVYQMDLDLQQISHSLVARLDDIITGMISAQQKPVFTMQSMQHFMARGKETFEQNTRTLVDEITDFRVIIEENVSETEARNEIADCLDALKEEITMDKPRMIILKTLLTYMRSKANTALATHLDVFESKVMDVMK
ncbi:TetR/AcrR family transcriptional regulator [Paenibacillus albiflavus]|uniref:TetR/AcrR family transcriptional regulator n=1 Tax=Paenibacillus albiflavus TaxID=2545760 RepID=UPI0014047560|nr:TetR/AcrR family transcriptional regulator [Paenibacillus albiflavus]